MRRTRRAPEPGDGAPADEPTARLRAVQRRLRLPARLRVRGLLSGEHGSMHKGRSMELDDLRHYERGDDVRDVDWKASARTGTVLMRRHVAERKQELLVVAALVVAEVVELHRPALVHGPVLAGQQAAHPQAGR